MKRVFLIGYMGAGKTTLGKVLATEMGLTFIDLDNYIESRYQKSVGQLFAEKGENEFRLIEKNVLHEIAEFEDIIIATGGGAPCFFDNMDFMNTKGITVYLRNTNKTLFDRLILAQSKRPLIKDKTPEELFHFIEDSVAKRSSDYEKCRIIFDADFIDDIQQIKIAAEALKQQILAYRE